MIEWVRGGGWHLVAESPEYDGTNDEDALEKIQISHNPLIELLEKKKRLLFYIYVATTAVLPSLKRLGVTHQTHHGRRPL